MSSVFSTTKIHEQSRHNGILKYVWKHSTCLVGGDLYALFGDQELSNGNKSYISSDVYVLNLKEQMWWKYPLSLSPGRRNAVVFLRDEEMFAVYGMGGVRFIRALQKLDVVLRQWETCTTYGMIPQARYSACGEYFGDKDLDLFLTSGGRGKNSNSFGDINVLDMKSLTWVTPSIKGKPPSRRYHQCSCAGRRTMFVYGGLTFGGYSNDLYILRFLNRTRLVCSELKGTRDARISSSLSLVNGRSLLLIGGISEDTAQDRPSEAYTYDLSKNEWMPVPDFNKRIRNHHAVDVG